MERLQELKAKLELAKSEAPDKFTAKHQQKLDETIGAIADIEDEIAEVKGQAEKAASNDEANAETKSSEYVPAKGTENHVHLSIVYGRRFNPRTGKEESAPYTQVFTKNEYELFRKNAASLGYFVVKVLHDPTGTANTLVIKD